jgi:hypothetical protein
MDDSDKTATEKSSKLGVPGQPAGDAEAIVRRNREDRAVVRRRKTLIDEAGGGVGSQDRPRDELGEDTVTKTIDDLIE